MTNQEEDVSPRISLIQHLLPDAKAWSITISKNLRKFFQSFADSLIEPIKLYADLAYLDLFPATTRRLSEWEVALGVWVRYEADEAQRRTDIQTAWEDRGGQSAQHLQDILYERGFTALRVYGWWETPVVNDPIPRDPHDYLSASNIIPEDGKGYALVNSVGQSGNLITPECGEDWVECDEELAQCGYFEEYYFQQKEYILPSTPDSYRSFIYVGTQIFGELANIDVNRREELEYLVYKHRPTNVWVGMLVAYTGGEQ